MSIVPRQIAQKKFMNFNKKLVQGVHGYSSRGLMYSSTTNIAYIVVQKGEKPVVTPQLYNTKKNYF